MAFDYTSRDKATHGHVVSAEQEWSKKASKGAQSGSFCPGNERCEVDFGQRPQPCMESSTHELHKTAVHDGSFHSS